jgi:HlyD family secretion protein
MPRDVNLRFGAPGTVREILVEKGDVVKEGTLLAKLDDTAQKIAVLNAQYDIESALSELAEKVYPMLMGYPNYYPSFVAVLRWEQAKENLTTARTKMLKSDHESAMVSLRLTQHDLQASLDMINGAPLTDTGYYPNFANVLDKDTDPMDLGIALLYPSIPNSVDLLERDIQSLQAIQASMGQGDYESALTKTELTLNQLEQTGRAVNSAAGSIKTNTVTYPDTSTSLSWTKKVEAQLEEIQKLLEDGDYDDKELAEKLRMAQFDLETSQLILAEDELVFKIGLDLKSLRQFNINLQKARVALQNQKEELMKTEILAPFDGTIIDVNVKVNDELSSFDYSSITAIQLVDVNHIELTGIVDEIDIFKVEVGQKAIIVLDALPMNEFMGTVTFISPVGTEETGVINFAVTIELDPTDVPLKGGLTATADIIVAEREDVILIPNRVVRGTTGNYWVNVLIDEEEGILEERQITVGIQNEAFTEITSGLSVGEKVILETPVQSTGPF